MLYLCALSVFLLMLPWSPARICTVTLLFGVACAWLCAAVRPAKRLPRPQRRDLLLSAVCCAALGLLFYLRWQRSNLLHRVAALVHVPAPLLLGLAVAALSCAATLGCATLARALRQLPPRRAASARRVELPAPLTALFLLATAVVLMAVCSKSSPLYPFNDEVDCNTLFTVGRSMLDGKVPFRDLFEQKGPLIYVIYAAGALVSRTSFLGVWLCEILSCFLFLLCLRAILRLYTDDRALALVPLIGALLYTAPSFLPSGTAELFCMPMLAYGLLVSVRALRAEALPTARESFCIGATAACVLWIKFTMLGFYIGWIAVPAWLAIRRREWARLFKLLGWIALGVAAATLPFVIYFGVNRAISDWLEIYLYDNLFLYHMLKGPNAKTLGQAMLEGLHFMIVHQPAGFFLSVFGLMWCIRHERALVTAHLTACFAGTFLFVYIGGRSFPYYAFIFASFIPWGMLMLLELFEGVAAAAQRRFPALRRLRPRRAAAGIAGIALLCACAALALLRYPDAWRMRCERDDLAQYRVRDYIASSGREDPTLLNYGTLDGGFYLAAGIAPTQRVFCGLNLPLKDLAEQQNACAAAGEVDFIVTYDEVSFPLYDLVATYPAVEGHSDAGPVWRLYERKRGAA